MIGSIPYDRLRPEDTGERAILRNRLVIGVLTLLCCAVAWRDPVVVGSFIGYLLCNSLLTLMHDRDVGLPSVRYLGAIALDTLMGYVIMSHAPEQMAFVYPIYLWMILGNGFRYGVAWIYIAAAFGVLSFGAVVLSSDYWMAQPVLAFALLAGLIVIPAYSTTLIRHLSRAKDEAEAANRSKCYFLASISHELRTPLNAIIGYGAQLEKERLTAEQHRMVNTSLTAGRHLLHLIEQLLYVSTSQSAPPADRMHRFRPADLLIEVRDMLSLRAEEKRLSLALFADPSADRMVVGPEDAIRNVLVNLASNAVKFTESGHVQIRCHARTGDDGVTSLLFSVADTGIGIAEQSIDKIFEPFQQADDTVLNRFGGTGLGLAICRQICEDIGGGLTVESQFGKGSRFDFVVPVTPAVDAIVPSDEGVATRSRRSILLLGPIAPACLAELAADFDIDHRPVEQAEAVRALIDPIRPGQFDLALLSARLAGPIDDGDPLWQMFRDRRLVPVLLADDAEVDVRDLVLRAEFASVIAPDASMQALRSAIRIGCSFGRSPPVAEADPPAARPAPVTLTRVPRRVLVADDNRTNRALLETVLTQAGHRCVMAEDGQQALDALENGGLDIALIDINMPVLDGIDATRMWRQIEDPRRPLPIIGVTADATMETRRRCLDAGMNDRFTKPIDSEALLDAIEQHCAATDREQVRIRQATDSAARSGAIARIGAAAVQPDDPLDPQQVDYLRSLGGDAFVLALLEDFRIDSGDSIARLDRAALQGNLPDLRFAAHALKSVSTNVGANCLAQRARELEQITAEAFDLAGPAHIAALRDELARVEARSQRLQAELAVRPAAAALS